MNQATELPSTHGHTILRWLAEQPMNHQSLQRRVDSELGGIGHFHTCDTTGLSLDELLALLAARGKIVPSAGDTWTSDLSKVCADE